MPHLLVEKFQPYLIYTFQPTSVSCSVGDYSFTFDASDFVHYKVSGGAEYVHKVWNYGSDMLTAVKTCWDGIRERCVVYNVDRMYMDEHHSLILLTPVRQLFGWVGISRMLHTNSLSRLRVSDGKFLRLNIMAKDGLSRSIGRVGTYAAADIPAQVDDSIAMLAESSKVSLSVAHVKSVVGNDLASATTLAEYHKTKNDSNIDCVIPVEKAVHHYTYKAESLLHDNKPTMEPFMSPLVHEAYAPLKSIGNEEQAVEERVLKLAQPEISVTPLISGFMDDFIQAVVGDDKVVPVDIDEVYKRQNRPSQVAILNEGSSVIRMKRTVKSFMKAEAYSEPKDPRVISTINPVDKLDYSRFIYAIDDLLKKQVWYAFGNTPKHIANRVASVARLAKHLIKTDFSRWDGRVSSLLREFERRFMLKAFSADFHKILVECMESQFNKMAVMSLGTVYETLLSRLSGSPETSAFNTLCNAFIAYCALRSEAIVGGYRDHQQAWRLLGIYGGDDGLTPDVNQDVYVKVAFSFGQKLTSEIVKRGDSGVVFLARVYSPYVWGGDPNCMCDVPRQLSKFHVTHKLGENVTPLMKLHEKCMGLYLTDRNTPILGPLAQRVVKHMGECLLGLGVANYFADYPINDQYPNECVDGWMLAYVLDKMPTLDLERFDKWMSGPFENILSPPLIVEPTVVSESKAELVVGDQLILPVKHPSVSDKVPRKVRRQQWKKKNADKVNVPVGSRHEF